MRAICFLAAFCMTLFSSGLTPAAEQISLGRVLDSQLRLTNRLLVELARRSPGGSNIVTSPASVAGVMSLLDLGADQRMHEAIFRTLGFEPDPARKSASDLDNLRKIIAEAGQSPKTNQIEFNLATAVLIDPATKPYAPAIAGMRALGAEVAVSSINDPAAIQHINDWVAEQTRNRIPVVLDGKQRMPGLVAVNALYFKGLWSGSFSEKETRPQLFHASTRNFKVPMMRRLGEYRSRRDGRFAAVEMPYGDGRYRLVLVTTPDLSSRLDQLSTVSDWIGGAGFERKDLLLLLPRFTIEGQVELLDALEAAGLKDGVESRTAFIGLAEIAQRISDIAQKTYLRVDEKGSEAAAATSTTVAVVSAAPAMVPPTFTFDRPFLFGLRDSNTGLILMAGYIDHPPAAHEK